MILAVFFLKENVRYPVWMCRDPISLILGTRFSLILGTRFSILGTRIGSLKHVLKTLILVYTMLESYIFRQIPAKFLPKTKTSTIVET